MKPKASTMAQRFGFADPDLTTPEHDALLLWLDTNVESLLRARLGGLERKSYSLDRYGGWNEINSPTDQQIAILAQYPLTETRFEFRKTWECPILDRNYTIGFCDMMVNVTRTRVNAAFYFDGDRLIDERPIESIDDKHRCWFEIKPKIPSLGELVRQLRMYQSYTNGDKWFVVSPDSRWHAQLEAQGFGFIDCNEGLRRETEPV